MKQRLHGSGLLFTVLTLALFTALSLTTIRSFIGITRTASRLQISKEAYSQAGQGLAEGLLWSSLPANAVGNQPTQFRGQDPTCTSINANVQTAEPSHVCPYYGFSVWRDVTLNTGTSFYELPAKAINRGVNGSVDVSVDSGPAVIKLKNMSTQDFLYSATNCPGFCSNILLSTSGTSSFTVTSDTKVTFGQSVSSLVPRTAKEGIVISSSNTASGIKIDRGFTTIASTGYVGGVVRRHFANIYQGDTAPFHPYEYESSDDIDANGCLVGYSDPTNPNDSSSCYSQRSDGSP